IPAREWFGFAVLGALHAIPVGFLAGLLAAHVPAVRAGVVAGLAPLVALLGGLGAATAPLFPLSRAISQSILPGVTWSPAGLRAIPIGAAAGIVAALLASVLLRRWLREARDDALAARTPEHAT
ncbi:MAG: hypothetical protein MUF21_11945, partial [Gemmatimonadaceae bacterium]|nr:hypothetical protein [Gemmatimonadaceae bacterium]